MYKYVKFENIDKHKWDSAVHYSPNGNIFGYHWYLKAVWRAFDAIIEDDYESILPIPAQAINQSDLLLLPELGPYAINRLTKQKVNNFVREASSLKHTPYPISSRIDKSFISSKGENDFYTLHMIDSYERIFDTYNQEAKNAISILDKDNIKISSGVKPEVLIENSHHTDKHNNALLRIMYHAMHKGIGWSSGIQSKETGKYLALSFFVNSHNTIHEIFAMQSPDLNYRYILYDLLIRQHAGKPSRIASIIETKSLTHLGFENEAIDLVHLGSKPLEKLKGWFSRTK